MRITRKTKMMTSFVILFQIMGLISSAGLIKSQHYVIAFSFLYFYSLGSFGISGTLAIFLKRHEKSLSPYLVATFSAPAIMLFVIFCLMGNCHKAIKMPGARE